MWLCCVGYCSGFYCCGVWYVGDVFVFGVVCVGVVVWLVGDGCVVVWFVYWCDGV